MASPTEQQEFLETLKDPTHANLLKACREFQADRYQSIKDIKVFKADSGGYTIRMFAANFAALKVAESDFLDLLRKYFITPFINVVSDVVTQVDGDYVRTFYVMEGTNVRPLAAGGTILNEAASSTNPTLIPNIAEVA